MDDHLRILQNRVEPVAISARDQIKRAAGISDAKRLEWTRHKIADREEEQLHSGEDHTNVRHQLAVLVAIDEKHRKNVNRQQKAPEKQRTFLPRPQRCNFEEG